MHSVEATARVTDGRPMAQHEMHYLVHRAGTIRAHLLVELLEELEAHAGGRLVVNVIDPQPFSEEEDRATQLGLQPVSLGTAGDNVFFGLAGSNSVGDEAVIPFLQPDKEPFLEYDVARLVYSLANPEKPVVGLMSGVMMSGGFDPQAQRALPPWAITQQVRQLFDVRTLRVARHLPVRLSLLVEDAGLGPAASLREGVRALGFVPHVYSPEWRLVDAAVVARAHADGMAVVPWTVNAWGAMQRLRALGVDGLITDYPDLGVRLLGGGPDEIAEG